MCVCVYVCFVVWLSPVFLQVINGHAVSFVISQLTNDYYKFVFLCRR